MAILYDVRVVVVVVVVIALPVAFLELSRPIVPVCVLHAHAARLDLAHLLHHTTLTMLQGNRDKEEEEKEPVLQTSYEQRSAGLLRVGFPAASPKLYETTEAYGTPYMTEYEIVAAFSNREPSIQVNGKTLVSSHNDMLPRDIVSKEMAQPSKSPLVFVRTDAALQRRHVLAADKLLYDPLQKRVPFPDELLAQAVE